MSLPPGKAAWSEQRHLPPSCDSSHRAQVVGGLGTVTLCRNYLRGRR